ncbi:MAG: hypothetical protein AAFU64_20605 [Bacteroidota bacterium]
MPSRISDLEEQGFVIKAQIQLPIYKLKMNNTSGKPSQEEVGRTLIISFARIR